METPAFESTGDACPAQNLQTEFSPREGVDFPVDEEPKGSQVQMHWVI